MADITTTSEAVSTSPNTANNSTNITNSHDTENGISSFAPTILVEIVSALNVPHINQNKEPDPYVQVFVPEEEEGEDGEPIHQTEVLYNTGFPIWSLECGSLFLIQAERNQQVKFVLREYERFVRDPVLGTLDISIQEMLGGQGKRREYPLNVPLHIQDATQSVRKKIVRKTRLVLRFKPATAQDIAFIRVQEQQRKRAGIYCKETYLPPQESTQGKSAAAKTLGIMPPIDEWGVSLFSHAAPPPKSNHPDPLLVEAMKPSQEWIQVGSPDAPGKVYVEVLACNDLPNLDTPSIVNFNNLTDAFCCLIVEDSIVNTSYIPDNLNPRWMPTDDHRAFVIGIQHPSSHLYLGVFNHNSTARFYKPLNAFYEWIHNPIGRVLINLTQFSPDTIYTLHYHLYEVSSEAAKDRLEGNHNGTLILRLRIEWEHQVLDGMGLPPAHFVSVPRKHDFQTATYTTVGERGSGGFSMANLTSYLEEIQSYVSGENVSLIVIAILTVLLWRGTSKVNLFGREINLPIHSIVAFTWGVLVTNDYNRFPSFAVFSVAWLFLASMEYHRQHPSPWKQCESYPDLFRAMLAEIGSLCLGDSSRVFIVRQQETIVANENIDQIRPYMEKLQRQKAMNEEVQRRKAADLEEEVRKHEAEMAVLSEASIATAKRETVKFFETLNPVKPILHPVQNILHQVCIYLRIVKSIVTWDENYYPFWIVTFCFLISALIFFIPWGWILRWLGRVLVWVFLGPWARIVDWYYFEQIETMTPEEKERYVEQQTMQMHKNFQAQRLQSRTEREDRVKLKSMMKYLFGKYVVQVPRFQQAQFLDDPLPESSAEPYNGTGEEVEIIGQVCGQSLVGDMIPSRTVQTHPFQKEIAHEVPSERISMRPSSASPLTQQKEGFKRQKKKKRRLSFRSWLKKVK